MAAVRVQQAAAAVAVVAVAAALAVAAAVPWSPVSAQTPTEFLRVSGKKVVSGAASDAPEVPLIGFSIGGWLCWEDDLLEGDGQPWNLAPGVSELELKEYLDDTQETAGAGERFFNGVRDNFIMEADVEQAKAVGANVLRVELAHWLFNNDVYSPRVPAGSPAGTAAVPVGFAALDPFLEWCETAGVYVVLAMRAAPGCQSAQSFCAKNDAVRLFDANGDNIDALVDVWTEIASRYANRTIIAGYDILDKPEVLDHAVLGDVYRQVLAGVRSVDSNHIVWFQGNRLGTDFTTFSDRWPTTDGNAALSLAMLKSSFCPFLSNLKAELEEFLRINIDAPDVPDIGVPIMVGEFGGDCVEWVLAAFDVLQERDEFTPVTYFTYKGLQSDAGQVMYNVEDHAPWTSLLAALTQEKFASESDWDAGFESLRASNFDAKDDYLSIFKKFVEGEELEYTYTGGWIIAAFVVGFILLVGGIVGLAYYLKNRKGKYDL